MRPGMVLIFASTGARASPMTLASKLEIASTHTSAKTSGKCVVSMVGPGSMPRMAKALSSTAMAGPFGTPRATVGISAPASLEIDDPSGAMIPSGMPVPNSSGCLDVRMACP